MERGAIIYKDFCNQCHRPTGKGIGRSFPPLAGSDYLMNKRTESIRGVKYGQQGEIVVNGKIYNGVMAPMGLSDQEVVDVMNYVMNSWGNEQDEIVTLEEVSSITKE
ncbi:MAG: cytochrome c [Flavobacteriaceae bacterium]|nr:cytochrome c [Flavobacteriaceae bacterium]